MEHANKGAASFQLDAAHPFLDRDVIAFLMSIPGAAINRDGVPKAILRDAVRNPLPHEIRARRWKAEFSHEILRGLRTDWRSIENLLLDPAGISSHGLSTRERIREQLPRWRNAISAGDVVAARRLQEVIALEQWLRAYCSV
jgi:asparagine synthase (glutamine-hydrolysing)